MIGDLIFFTGRKSLWSRLIRFGLGTDITHVAVQYKLDLLIEITPEGFRMRKDTPISSQLRLRPIAPHNRKYTALERLVDLYSNQQVSYGWFQAFAIWARR